MEKEAGGEDSALTGLQEPLQVHGGDELLPVVRATGHNTQQLLSCHNAQRVRQVGLTDGGDEEGAPWLHGGEKHNSHLHFMITDSPLFVQG